jgi:putative endonuclease
MMNQRQAFGKAGEITALIYLKKKGYKVLEQNYTCPLGEIDIIARHKRTIVFIEVKTRRSLSYGSPLYAITRRKQRKISMAALYYLKSNRQMDQGARFDVVTVQSTDTGQEIDLIQNAFDLAYE